MAEDKTLKELQSKVLQTLHACGVASADDLQDAINAHIAALAACRKAEAEDVEALYNQIKSKSKKNDK